MDILNKIGNWLSKKSLWLTDVSAWRNASPQTHTGSHVSIQSALQLATVWACIRLISETIATLPLIVYKRNANDDGRKVARNHWLYLLVHDSPNANMTAVEYWECIVAQICIWGNAYSRKTITSDGIIVSLDPLKPELMVVKTDKYGALRYCYSDPRGYIEYPESEIFHIKGFGIDGLMGLSPITHARNSLGAAIAADEASAKIFSNGMRAAGALTMPGILNPAQREQARDSLAAQLAGAANSGKIMILEGGATYTPLSINPDDAQMLGTREFNIAEICRWFRVPPSMIGHGDKTSNWGTGLEQQMMGFLTFALRPYIRRIEQAITKSLLQPSERARINAEFSVEGLLRADSAGRAAFYASAAQNGWMTRNEIRALENWPTAEGADTLTAQANLLPLDRLGVAPTQAPGQAPADTTTDPAGTDGTGGKPPIAQ